MKGSFQIARKLLRKACAEGVAGVGEQHLRVLDALTNDDLADIKTVGDLSSSRAVALSEDKQILLETVALLRQWLQGPSDEVLEQHGISITKINDGMSIAEYQEFDEGEEED